jgi:hypothetical protein
MGTRHPGELRNEKPACAARGNTESRHPTSNKVNVASLKEQADSGLLCNSSAFSEHVAPHTLGKYISLVAPSSKGILAFIPSTQEHCISL